MSGRVVFGFVCFIPCCPDIFGFVSHITRKTDSYDAELGHRLQVVLMRPFVYDEERARSHVSAL